jgi:hypothetical protein
VKPTAESERDQYMRVRRESLQLKIATAKKQLVLASDTEVFLQNLAAFGVEKLKHLATRVVVDGAGKDQHELRAIMDREIFNLRSELAAFVRKSADDEGIPHG